MSFDEHIEELQKQQIALTEDITAAKAIVERIYDEMKALSERREQNFPEAETEQQRSIYLSEYPNYMGRLRRRAERTIAYVQQHKAIFNDVSERLAQAPASDEFFLIGEEI